MADAFDHHIGAAPLRQALNAFQRPFGVGDHFIGAAAFRQLGALRVQFHGDNRRGAQQACQLNMHVADGAGADDDHGFGNAQADFFVGAHHAGERLGQAGFAVGQAIFDRDHQVRRHRHVFGKGAVAVDADLLHVFAVEDLIAAAVKAVAAADIDIGDHPLAQLDAGNPCAGGGDLAGKLVARD